MAKMHNANGRRDLHATYRAVTDRAISTPRCSTVTGHIVRTARTIRDNAVSYGHTCERVLLVFVDDKVNERVAAVVFSMDKGNTLIVRVDNRGNVTDRTWTMGLRTDKNLPRSLMYSIAGEIYYSKCLTRDGKTIMVTDPDHDKWHTKVYARNLCCYGG